MSWWIVWWIQEIQKCKSGPSKTNLVYFVSLKNIFYSITLSYYSLHYSKIYNSDTAYPKKCSGTTYAAKTQEVVLNNFIKVFEKRFTWIPTDRKFLCVEFSNQKELKPRIYFYNNIFLNSFYKKVFEKLVTWIPTNRNFQIEKTKTSYLIISISFFKIYSW